MENKPLSQEPKIADHSDDLQKAINSDCPKFYFNGFTTALGIGDVVIVLKQNEKPVAVLNTSFTLAKTLVQKLGGIIQVLESKTQNKIMTTEQVKEAIT